MALDKETVVRAWKDETFRNSLSEEDRAALPPSPIGDAKLSDEELQAAAGAGLGNLIPLSSSAPRTCSRGWTSASAFGPRRAAGSRGGAVGAALGLPPLAGPS